MLRLPLALVVPTLVLALVGCSTPTVIPPAAPPSDEAPLFATDEEALAAATEAYEEFLAALDSALANPDSSEVVLDELATDDVLEQAYAAVEEFRAVGWRAIGAREVVNSSLQQLVQEENLTVATIYVCETTEGVDVVDEFGLSQVANDREPLTAFEVTVTFSSPPAGVIQDRAQWASRDVCGA